MNPLLSLAFLLFSAFLLPSAQAGFFSGEFSLQTILGLAFYPDGTMNPALREDLDYLNANYVGKLPGIVKTVFGNEKINVKLSLEDGTVAWVGVVTESEKIRGIWHAKLQEATLEVELSETTIKKIAKASDKKQAFLRALKAGEISYHGIGFLPSLKTGILSLFQTIYFFFASP